MSASTIVDSRDLRWENGLDYLATIEPQFRENLGPQDQLERNFARYWQKNLHLDAETSRRLDLIRLDPGYRDLAHCYHDSVEEAFILEGACQIDGEGVFRRGDYFWRPPGWIHLGASETGCEAVLGFEGRSDESGPVSRYIRPAEEAGTNALYPPGDERALGARGRVRHVESDLLVWQPGPAFARSEGPLEGFDLERVSVRVLSKNPVSGRQTILLRLHPGYRQAGPGSHTATVQGLVLSGSLDRGATVLGSGVFVHRPAGVVEEAAHSKEGAFLLVKADGFLDFRLEG